MTSTGKSWRESPSTALRTDPRLDEGEVAVPINVLAAILRSVGGNLVLTEDDIKEYNRDTEYFETAWSEERHTLTLKLTPMYRGSDLQFTEVCAHPFESVRQIISFHPYFVTLDCERCGVQIDKLTSADLTTLSREEINRRGFRL